MPNIHRSFLSISAAVLTVFIAACTPENEEVVNVVRPVRVVTVEENQAGQTVQFAGTVVSAFTWASRAGSSDSLCP